MAKSTKKAKTSHLTMVATLVVAAQTVPSCAHSALVEKLAMDAPETPAPKQNTVTIQIAVDLTTVKVPANHAHKPVPKISTLFVDVTTRLTTTPVKPLLLAFPTSTKVSVNPPENTATTAAKPTKKAIHSPRQMVAINAPAPAAKSSVPKKLAPKPVVALPASHAPTPTHTAPTKWEPVTSLTAQELVQPNHKPARKSTTPFVDVMAKPMAMLVLRLR
jgi:hypothetical protein